jgi:hypothetical protein
VPPGETARSPLREHAPRASNRTLLLMMRGLMVVLLLVSCASAAETPVHRYLAARTLDEAMSVLAPEYRLWFGARSGAGMDRVATAQMLQWDYALHPRHRIEALTIDGNVITARVHEENDFSRLIGFPGWTASSTYTLDAEGRIASQVYVPREGQPEWRPHLDAPLLWLREHHPDALTRIFPDGKLAQTRENAAEWVRLLREWRAATGQPNPTR